VTNQDGTRIALFRGKSYQIKGEVLEGLAATVRKTGS
jgi:acyl-CoA thioesterase